jgi:hypothetical protein
MMDVPTLVQLEGPLAAERAEAEAFVREAFLAAYGARIEHFLPNLMVLRNDCGQLLAVLGLRDAMAEYVEEEVGYQEWILNDIRRPGSGPGHGRG